MCVCLRGGWECVRVCVYVEKRLSHTPGVLALSSTTASSSASASAGQRSNDINAPRSSARAYVECEYLNLNRNAQPTRTKARAGSCQRTCVLVGMGLMMIKLSGPARAVVVQRRSVGRSPVGVAAAVSNDGDGVCARCGRINCFCGVNARGMCQEAGGSGAQWTRNDEISVPHLFGERKHAHAYTQTQTRGVFGWFIQI